VQNHQHSLFQSAAWQFGIFPNFKKKENLALLVLALIFTRLSSTDHFPKFIGDQWIFPYLIKVVPCILIWIKILYDMMAGNIAPRLGEDN